MPKQPPSSTSVETLTTLHMDFLQCLDHEVARKEQWDAELNHSASLIVVFSLSSASSRTGDTWGQPTQRAIM